MLEKLKHPALVALMLFVAVFLMLGSIGFIIRMIKPEVEYNPPPVWPNKVYQG